MDAVELLILLFVGLLAGTATSSMFMSGRTSTLFNMLLGVAGAIIGQFILNVLDLNLPDVLNKGISLAEVITAIIGATIVLLVARGLRQ